MPKEQAIVLAGFPGVDIRDPKRDALTMLSQAMNGLSSELALAVRDDRGLAYYVGSYQQIGLDPGMFVIYAGTHLQAVPQVEELYRTEIQRLRTDGISDEEFERARNRIIADHEMSLQNKMDVAMTCCLDELYGLGYAYSFSTPERFMQVTRESIRQAAVDVLTTNNMVVSIVTPPQDAEPQQEEHRD